MKKKLIRIITSYGTLKNFLDCHEQDYTIIRENVVKFYSAVSDANRRYMTKTETLLKMVEDGKIRKDEMYKAIKMIRREICIQIYSLLLSFIITSFFLSKKRLF